MPEEKRLDIVMNMDERRLEREMAIREADRKHEEGMMQLLLMMNHGYQYIQNQRYPNTPSQMMNT